ncbi:E3 SUMO-protein ligase ZBED1-like [Sycon ciliatum]|uniref:E3 SUMO-protein ligase ZBED1-like n=1 Tax=Sycon ciliatum TaxID=27933 RepID=UPI0031F6C10C
MKIHSLTVAKMELFVLCFCATPGRILWEELKWPSLVCAAHRIQNALRDALDKKTLSSLFAKCRHLVGHFKHSALKTGQLEDKQRLVGAKEVKHLVQDCATRWNSVYLMLDRLVQLKVPVQLVLADMPDKDRRSMDLSADQWATAEHLLDFLRSVDQVTTSLGGEQYSTLSWLLPLPTALKSHCQTGDDDDLLVVACVKQAFADSITRRFHLDGLDVHGEAVLAAALDPRFRALKFFDLEQQHEVQQTLISYASVGCSPCTESSSSSSEPPAKRRCLLDQLLCDDGEDEDSEGSIEAEVAAYLAEKPVKRSVDPLLWWSTNAARFPRLAPLARKYLCIPATSVASERVFSFAGQIVDKRRSKLSAEMIDAQVFLHKNAHIIDVRVPAPPKPAMPLVLAAVEDDDEPSLPDLPSQPIEL